MESEREEKSEKKKMPSSPMKKSETSAKSMAPPQRAQLQASSSGARAYDPPSPSSSPLVSFGLSSLASSDKRSSAVPAPILKPPAALSQSPHQSQPASSIQRLGGGGGSNNQARPLDKFIVLQSASGAFNLDDRFESATGLNGQKINSTIPAALQNASGLDAKVRVSIWVTAIALAFLEKKFAAEANDWVLIKEKITKFIARTLKPLGINVDEVISAAKTLV
jgi:hypothetical protein